MLKNIVFFLMISIIASACSKNNLPPGERAGGFRLADPEKHSKVLKALQSENIPFEINDRGMAVYMLENQAKVLGVIRDIQHDGVIDPNYFESQALLNQEIKTIYINEFKEAKIPFRLDFFNEDEYIFWSQTYGTQVDSIQQKINLELGRRSKAKAIEKGKIPASLAY